MKELMKLMQSFIDSALKEGAILVTTKFDSEKLWELYLSNLAEEDNPIFRDPSSSSHNCRICKDFLRRYGNLVLVYPGYRARSIFNFSEASQTIYEKSFIAMSTYIERCKLDTIFVETLNNLLEFKYEKTRRTGKSSYTLGISSNKKRYTREEAEKYSNSRIRPNQVVEFNHFSLVVPKEYIDTTSMTQNSIISQYRDNKTNIRKGFEQISIETLELVSSLFNEGFLKFPEQYPQMIQSQLEQRSYWDNLNSRQEEIYLTLSCRDNSRFRSSLVGVLCREIEEGKKVTDCINSWNKRVDPANFKVTKSFVTKKQFQEADKVLSGQGYHNSFDFEGVHLGDIDPELILHQNQDVEGIPEMKIFQEVGSGGSGRFKRADINKLSSISMEKFLKEVLPTASKVEILFENRHTNNLVSLFKPRQESKPILNTPISWTYKRGHSGVSQIAETVKSLGGDIEGFIRFSIAWSGKDSTDNSDLDAHCNITNNSRKIAETINFRKKFSSTHEGKLDVDIQTPKQDERVNDQAVENIVFKDKNKLKNTEFVFKVHQYSERNSKGFKAEFQIANEIFSYTYKHPLPRKKFVPVVQVVFDEKGDYVIKHKLAHSENVTEHWNIETGSFHQVELICPSPNYWSGKEKGNKNYMFFIKDCFPNEKLKPFHNDMLIPSLYKFRKQIQFLSEYKKVQLSKNHLAGLGFPSSIQDEIVVKVYGKFKRMLKVQI